MTTLSQARATLMGVALSTCLLLPATSYAEDLEQVDERPTAMAMMGDAFIARPFLLAGTVIGATVFTVALPFSAMGGKLEESWNTLVVGIAKPTFQRCLGCTDVQDRWKHAKEEQEAREAAEKAAAKYNH